MPWFAASAIMYIKFKDGNQDSYPIWENVFLVEADSPEKAEEKAIELAKQGEGDSQNSLTWGERPATWVFAGLRKLLTVSHPDIHDTKLDGAEITYSEFEIDDKKSFQKFVDGKDVTIKYYSD